MTATRGPFVPPPRPSEEDLLELREPYDLPGPEYPDLWLPGRPEFVIDITQLRGLLPDQTPSLDQILENRVHPQRRLRARPGSRTMTTQNQALLHRPEMRGRLHKPSSPPSHFHWPRLQRSHSARYP